MITRVPVLNLYFMLCYAWNLLDEGLKVKVDRGKETSMLDLLVRVLLKSLAQLIRQGIERGYVAERTEVPGMRGKWLLGPTIKQNLLYKGKTICEYDQFQEDILVNQLIKSTLHQLIFTSEIDPQLHGQLILYFRMLNGVTLMERSPQAFAKVRLHRNNARYRFPLKVCELIQDQLLPREADGRYEFQDFVRDHQKMAALFEQFVFNFYRTHLKNNSWRVYAPKVQWKGSQVLEGSDLTLPDMRTDIVLEGPDRTIIIDTKFYHEASQSYFNSQTIKSANLYQLHTYLTHWPKQDTGRSTGGMLLYPQVGKPVNGRFIIHGFPVRVATINLHQDWQVIERDLLAFIQLSFWETSSLNKTP